MRYLAININYKLDQDWYCRCASVPDCYKYFDSLGPGHGPRVAIYDIEEYKYLWIDENHLENDKRLNGIVFGAMKKIGHLVQPERSQSTN
ncbi:MAG TPA: hypothetical protein VGC08_14060 [Pedobacter sp.]